MSGDATVGGILVVGGSGGDHGNHLEHGASVVQHVVGGGGLHMRRSLSLLLVIAFDVRCWRELAEKRFYWISSSSRQTEFGEGIIEGVCRTELRTYRHQPSCNTARKY